MPRQILGRRSKQSGRIAKLAGNHRRILQRAKADRNINGPSFPILTDKNGELAVKLGIRWTLQDYAIPYHQGFGLELPRIHGDGQWNLPMPARYVVDAAGTIAYAEVNPDYTRRPEPSDLFPVLDDLSASAEA